MSEPIMDTPSPVFEEKQIPVLQEDGTWLQTIYLFDNELKQGHAMDSKKVELTEEEITLEYPDLLNPLPETIEVDLFGLASDSLFAYKDSIHAWLNFRDGKNYRWINNLFNRGTVSVNQAKLDQMAQIVNEDKDDDSNPLTPETGAVLLAAIGELKKQVK